MPIKEEIELIFKNLKEHIKPEYRKMVFQDRKPIEKEYISSDIGDSSKPEEFTKNHLIYKIISLSKASKVVDTEIDVPMIQGHRWADCRVDIDSRRYLLEAKKLNEDLFDSSPSGGVNQIRCAFLMASVKEKYDGGIATDGLTWIFFDNNGVDKEPLNILKDTNKIFKILDGEKIIKNEIKQEDISRKFYKMYSNLLNGGGRISKEDCLINSLIDIRDEDREEIAQRIINRLIFIKMLQSKDIIKKDVINYVAKSEPGLRNFKLNQLFFKVMNKPQKERDSSIDSEFSDIPYLNGGLFSKSEAENNNPDYSIKPEILQSIAVFLDSFKYADEWDESSESLDPEILGYIFEMAMAETERSNTGSFYTPKEITQYMAQSAISNQIVFYTNSKVISQYVNVKNISKLDDLFDKNIMGSNQIPILTSVLNDVVLKLRICDNACGSGAFLLAVSNVLFKICCKIRDCVGLATRDVSYKIMILKDCVYGVDINKKAVEIAKLRLWLWLIGSYTVGDLTPLPNIDYNIRCGNSIVGYVDISKFSKVSLTTLDSWSSDGAIIASVIKRKEKLIAKYKDASGNEAKKIKSEIIESTNKIKDELNKSFFLEEAKKFMDSMTFLSTNSFHWGLEFGEIYEEGGFDIIIGNPPYVENKEINPKIKEFYKNRFSSAYKLYDLSVLFIESSYRCLKNNGCMYYITTNKFLASEYGVKIRKLLLDNTDLECLIDVSYIRIFKEASAYPVIIGYKKSVTKGNCLCTYPHIESTDYFEEELLSKRQLINQDDFRLTENLVYNISERIDICQKMSNGNVVKLSSLSPCLVYRPFGFTNWGQVTDKFVNAPSENTLRVIGTPSISRYYVNDEKINLDNKRFDVAYIDKNDISNKTMTNLSKPQILIKEVSKLLTVAYTCGSEYAHLTGIYGLYFEKEVNLYYIMGLLNSNLINFYYGSYYGQMHLSGGYWKINGSYLKTIPIAIVDDDVQNEIESIVKKLIVYSNNVDANHDEYNLLIDKLNDVVYKIYNISDDEREFVDNYNEVLLGKK